MCFHNLTQHNGCGHIGESYTHPWTLCDSALHRLNSLRGPNASILSPPASTPSAPRRRSSSTRRFLSLSGTLSRSSTSASTCLKRNASGASRQSRASTSVLDSSSPAANLPVTVLDYAMLPDHQLLAVRCADPTMRTQVSRDMDVCKSCKRWIVDMQHMLVRYEKTGSIKGTSAFDEFLSARAEVGNAGVVGGAGSLRGTGSIRKAENIVQGDVTVPLRDSVMGMDIGARQAIILGCPEENVKVEWRGGLEGLEKNVEERRRVWW